MLVHSFESMAARDGDGLRYAVFLAGCPLRCVYCHNPDTWTPQSGMEYTNEHIFKKIKMLKNLKFFEIFLFKYAILNIMCI